MDFNWKNAKVVRDTIALLANHKFMSDVKFEFANDKIIFAHSLILAARSEEFYEKCKSSANQCRKSVNVHDVSYEIFLEFINFIYSDEIVLMQDNVNELFALAVKYKMIPLQEKCIQYIQKELSPKNICTIFDKSKDCDFEVDQIMRDMISDNYSAVLKTPAFLNIDWITLHRILKMDPVSDINEFEVFQSCINWSTKQCEKCKCEPGTCLHRKLLGDNLKLIRFGAMSMDEFAKCQQIAPGLLSSDEISAIFMNIATKIPNKFGYSDQCRMRKVKVNSMDFKYDTSLHGYNIINGRTMIIDPKDLEDTYVLSLTPSKIILLTGLSLCIELSNSKFNLAIIENGMKIAVREVSLPVSPPVYGVYHNGNEYVSKIETINFDPVILYPFKKYNIEYTFSNYQVWPKHTIKVEKYKRDNQIDIYDANYRSLKFTIHKCDSHLYGVYFKLLYNYNTGK